MARTLAKCGLKNKPARLPALWFLTDEKRVHDVTAALRVLPRGAGVIFRHYGVPDRDAVAAPLAAQCRSAGLLFLVANDWRLAAKIGADGLHLSEAAAARGLAAGARLWRAAHGGLLTAAAHGSISLARARKIAASAALLSPIFPTQSHPGRAALGIVRAAALVRRAGLPVIGLGGVLLENWNHLDAAGFAGLAGIAFALRGEKIRSGAARRRGRRSPAAASPWEP